ncbi:hypothetical protein QVD17_05863 [Tagetes erecta]|uniref:Dynamin stalk domain-containing protein n=1 Tax=Tagetes erecta TaxID=13708 RepID=A0AAD8LF30_TARER|nr:hypothetical protein QVD17_05862 [Tagetes erecta]KAK1440038.1 hypothetical protein QVD17_05863 [Tagetes erecta]
MSGSKPKIPSLIKQISERMKEPFNIITKLKDMEVFPYKPSTPQCFKPSLPSIVVLGEEYDGTSVISKLFGLSLPSNAVFPVILKFKDKFNLGSGEVLLEWQFKDTYFQKKVSQTNLEEEITKSLKKRVPYHQRSGVEVIVTLVDPKAHELIVTILPGIHKQEENEKKQMSLYEDYLRRYTKDNESLFLNVIGCSSDLRDCLSKKLLSTIDRYGRRTITVFTQLHLSSNYLISKVTSTMNEPTNPFGYFFIKDAEKTVARDEESAKRVSCLLSKTNESRIGFESLSKNLVLGLISILFSPSSQIVGKIMLDLKRSEADLARYQATFDSASDAIPRIVRSITNANISIRKLFVTQEYEEYPDEMDMHVGPEISDRFLKLTNTLLYLKHDTRRPFLTFELWLLNETNWPSLTNFLPLSLAIRLLDDLFSYAHKPIESFLEDLISYVECVVVRILLDHGKQHVRMHETLKKMARLLVNHVKERFKDKVEDLINLEKKAIFTSSDQYPARLYETHKVTLPIDKTFASIEGMGYHVKVDHLNIYPSYQVDSAFQLKQLMVVYWDFVVQRFVDYCALYFQSIMNEMMAEGVMKVMEDFLMKGITDESILPRPAPTVDINKQNLENRIDELTKIMKEIEKMQVKFDFLL